MRLVTFKLKQTNGEARPQVGALAKDGRSVFNLTDALDDLTSVTDAAGAGGLLGCFDLAAFFLTNRVPIAWVQSLSMSRSA